MIRIDGLAVELGEFHLEDINLEINRGEYFIILGPTGAGKTVLLEAMAGLNPVKRGRIYIDDTDVTKMEPEKRGIGFVYQDFMLFPHLTVKGNIIFGLKRRKRGKQEIEEILSRLVDLLNIRHLMDRKPPTLSGGESQKVSLARALSINPRVVLLDEPLSALDQQQREVVQKELRSIQQRLGQTFVHVTHDFEEAVALGDRIAVMGGGRILQTGTPEEIFRQPNSEVVARFAMSRNVFSGEVRDDGSGGAAIDIDGVKLEVVTDIRGHAHSSIRPEDILISRDALVSSARNSLKGRITHIDDRGATLYLTVGTPVEFICLVTRRSFEELGLSRGDEAYLTFKASAVHIF